MAIVSRRQPPQAQSYFLSHDRGGVVDQHVLYHGLDAIALARMRAAQVLFLGNSREQLPAGGSEGGHGGMLQPSLG